jgi:hypothetical protein
MKITVYKEGLCTASVCAPAEMTKEEVEAEMPGTGIRSQWVVADRPFATGETNPCPCNNDPDYRHWLMEC